MVKLNKIYTRTGDEGTTGLVGGERRSKSDIRVVAYGTIDEANSVIGIVRTYTNGEADLMLARIQQDLFDLGADIATPYDMEELAGDERSEATSDQVGAQPVRRMSANLRIIETQVLRLEQEIDAMNAELSPLNSFILPGGEKSSAHLHLARTVVRRAERLMFELAEKEQINHFALQYINRLSDHLFVAARFLNDMGNKDILWIAGINR